MGPLLLGNIRDMFLQELESLLVDMDGDKLAGCPETQVLAPDPSCMECATNLTDGQRNELGKCLHDQVCSAMSRVALGMTISRLSLF